MHSFLDEYDYLIHLVRCTIQNHAPSEIKDGAMFDSVYKCAVKHDIANLAYYSVEKLRNKPEPELARKWEARRNIAITREINQSFARSEILDEFKRLGIRSTEVQGTRMKELYPAPEYRTMSDIDFIIDADNLGKAAEVLEGLGYSCKYSRGVEVDGFREPNIYVEIHTEFFPEDSKYYGKLGDPFDGVSQNDDYSCQASDEVFYIYNVMHIAKHYYFAGCGIRRILDLYYLNTAFPHIASHEKTVKFFEDTGLAEFVADASALARCWFGETETEPDERLSEMISVIKAAGIHGTLKQKLNNSLTGGESKGKGRYVLRRLFPEMWVFNENYPITKKYPVLVPFCWFHRSFKAITKNRKRLASEMRDIRETDAKNK